MTDLLELDLLELELLEGTGLDRAPRRHRPKWVSARKHVKLLELELVRPSVRPSISHCNKCEAPTFDTFGTLTHLTTKPTHADKPGQDKTCDHVAMHCHTDMPTFF